jgi:signal transduction histidine kinase
MMGTIWPGAIASDIISPGASRLHSDYEVGFWIWATQTFDKQTCRFWRAFDVPSSAVVTNARLSITADNSYRFFLDGRELGRGVDWKNITQHDLTQVLPPGTHVLAIEAFNEYNEAGMLMGLRVALKDGRRLEVASDDSWRIVPDSERRWMTTRQAPASWPRAKIIAPVGGGPWAWTLQQEAAGTGVPNPWFHLTREPPHQPAHFNFWQSSWFQVTLIVLYGSIVVVCFRLLGQLALHKKAKTILELERVRIARDIHDDLGAGLTQLVVFGEVAKNELPSGSAGRAKLAEVCDRGRNLLRAIDEVVWLVNSRRDTLRDFEAYVCSYAEKFLEPTPIRCRLEINEDMPSAALDLAIRRNLFLAVKEALNNAVRHSCATELFVRFRLVDWKLVVEVEDNGKGFDAACTDASRNGLANMAQRLSEVGGKYLLTSQPGGGCHIEFLVPLAQRARLGRLMSWGWRRHPQSEHRGPLPATVATPASPPGR